MLEPPADLAPDVLRDCLRAQYGLDVAEILFLPLGHDAAAWVYRVVAADGGVYFLKLRLRLANEAGLLVPRHLHEHGLARVVAPLPTVNGALWTRAAHYAVVLYRFVESRTGMAAGMSDAQWIAYGALLRGIHARRSRPIWRGSSARDVLARRGRDVRRLDAHIGGRAFEDPAGETLAAFWQAERAMIRRCWTRAEDLGQRLARTSPDLVLCHADIHTNNVLVDADGQIWIVDWDETMLAPRERDLMFVVGGGMMRGCSGRGPGGALLRRVRRDGVDPVRRWRTTAMHGPSATSARTASRSSHRSGPRLGYRRRGGRAVLSLFAPGSIVERRSDRQPGRRCPCPTARDPTAGSRYRL